MAVSKLTNTLLETLRSLTFVKMLMHRLSKMNPRTRQLSKNVLGSSVLKVVSILLSLTLVPITLGYLDKERYGIWLTLVSLTSWIYFFDIGLGQGLRNRFAKAKAQNDDHLASVYVSTTYYLMFFVVLIMSLLFCIINPFLQWDKILSTSPSLADDVRIIPWFTFLAFFLTFFLRLINTVLIADQRPAYSDLLNVIVYTSNTLGIIILNYFAKSSLLLYALIFSFVPPVVMFIANLIYFTGRYKNVRPRLSLVDTSYKKDLLGFGLWFFLLSCCNLLLHNTSNLILSHFLGPTSVVPYHLGMRYFDIGTMMFQIVLTPFWSAVTHAYHRNDIEWIRKTIGHLVKIFGIFVIGMLLMLVANRCAFRLWVGDKVQLPWMLAITIFLYKISLLAWGIYVHFINGVGKIRIQVIYAISQVVVFIGLVYLTLEILHLGPTSVALSLLLVTFPGVALFYYQYRLIITNTAKGLWNK